MANIKCLFAVEQQWERPHHCKWHTHACAEIIFYRNCTGWLSQGTQRHRYGDGDVAVYQPGLEHADDLLTPGAQLCVGIKGCGIETVPCGVWPAPPELRRLADTVRHEVSAGSEDREARLDILAGWLALELRRLFHPSVGAAASLPYHVQAAKEILDTQYTAPLSIRQVAETLFISPDYLRQMFREALGESPLHYLIRRRLDAAQELLGMTELTVAEVSRRTGFDNAYYFCRLFKKHTDETPTAWRQRHHRETEARSGATRKANSGAAP